MKWQTTESIRIAPLALAGLLIASQAHAADTSVQKRDKELLQRLSQSDAKAAALQRKIEQLEARLDALRNAIAAASSPSTHSRPAVMIPASSARTMLAQAETRRPPRPLSRTPPDRSKPVDRPAPGAFEIDEEAAQRALERTLTQSGALLLPVRTFELTPSFTYRRDELTTSVPATFTPPGGGAPATVLVNRRTRRNENIARLDFRAGMPYNMQLEASLPYNYVRTSQVTDFGNTTSDNGNGNGTGDFTLGVAKTLTREKGWKPDLIGRLSYGFGNGSRQDNGVGLTGGYRQLQAELVGIKRQDPIAFVASAFFAKSFEKDGIRPGDAVGFSLSSVLAASPATSLQFGFSQIHRQEQELNGVEISGSDQTYGVFNIGASSVLSRDLTLVTQFGIGLGGDAPEYTFTVSLPFLLR